MAAAYQTGTASSPTNLLQTLVTWLVAQGWTQDASAADASGWRAHLHKSGLYVNLRAAMNERIWNYDYAAAAGYGIGLYLGDAYSGASNWRSQSGGPLQSGTANVVGAGMQLNSGSVIAYHFFDNGSDHITVVVERTPGNFVFMGWGPSLVKTGYATDFPYFFGSTSSFYNVSAPAGVAGATTPARTPLCHTIFPGTSVFGTAAFFKVDATTFAARWVGISASTSTDAGYTGKHGRGSLNQSLGPNASLLTEEYPNYRYLATRLNASAFVNSMLMPLHCFVNNASARWAPVGYPPSVFMSAATASGFGPGQVYSVGGVDYMVFPDFAVLKAA